MKYSSSRVISIREMRNDSGYRSAPGSFPKRPPHQLNLDLEYIRFNPPPQIRILPRPIPADKIYNPAPQRAGRNRSKPYMKKTKPENKISQTTPNQTGLKTRCNPVPPHQQKPDPRSGSSSGNQPSPVHENPDPRSWVSSGREKRLGCSEPGNFSNYTNLEKSLNQYSCSIDFYTPEMLDLLLLAQACDIVRTNWE